MQILDDSPSRGGGGGRNSCCNCFEPEFHYNRKRKYIDEWREVSVILIYVFFRKDFSKFYERGFFKNWCGVRILWYQ